MICGEPLPSLRSSLTFCRSSEMVSWRPGELWRRQRSRSLDLLLLECMLLSQIVNLSNISSRSCSFDEELTSGQAVEAAATPVLNARVTCSIKFFISLCLHQPSVLVGKDATLLWKAEAVGYIYPAEAKGAIVRTASLRVTCSCSSLALPPVRHWANRYGMYIPSGES